MNKDRLVGIRFRLLIRSGLLGILLTLVWSVGGGPSLHGQDDQAGWVFTSSPLFDLWFHGMAVVDPVGPGPNALYDTSYPSRLRQERDLSGAPASVLEARAGYFRSAFRQDPSFQVLHFLPLYFPQAGRTEVFAALGVLAQTQEGLPQAPSARTAFGLAAVGSVLTTPEQRQLLGEFATDLYGEWGGYLEGRSRSQVAERELLHSSLNRSWRDVYAPVFEPFLRGEGLSGGAVFLVPSIGAEGRIFGGSPENFSDNILVISAPVEVQHEAEAVYSMLRELSFPLVRRVLGRVGGGVGDSDEEERIAVRAAIRSGALILERYRPTDVNDYQRFFLSQAGRTAPGEGSADEAFRDVFPLMSGLEDALRTEISSQR